MKTKFLAHFSLHVLFFMSIGWPVILANKTLFSPGQEYTYLYETLVTTGTEEPVSYASAYRLKGNLRIQAISDNVINVKLDDFTVGLYNGPWSYFPIPNFQQITAAELSSMSEPFQVQTENGKFKALVMNDQEPEYASNLKRGIATYLQMDLKAVTFDKVQISKIPEQTTMGECDTEYEILPVEATKSGLARVSKYRNHANCPDVQTRTRYATKIFYACPTKQTRNIMNSTAYATYSIDNSHAEKLTIKHIVVFSSVLYWPFTVKSPYLYTWLNMTLALTNVGPVTNPIPSPENSENHEDLSFVFEQNDLNDPEDEAQDFRSAEPFLFHYTSGESDPEILQDVMQQLHKVTEEVAHSLIENKDLNDIENFHKNSPFAIIPLIAYLDYDSLKQCYSRYSEDQTSKGAQGTLEFQLFLDGLILAGNWPSTLTVRDILISTEDPKILGRLIPSFPHVVRNPTEALAKELDPLFELTSKSSLSKTVRRMLELSLASFISKCCQKSSCTTTGLLDKYIKYFQDKLALPDVESQTVGVLGLRNLGIGKALDKLIEIAQAKINVPQSVRVQAIWSLRPLAYSDREGLFSKLRSIFYNRAESCEIRTNVFSFLISCNPDKNVLHEIAYYMWTETCPQTLNMVRSTLTNLANTKQPCNPNQEHARTILKYLPPGAVDPTKTAGYAVDYYDDDYGFGHMTTATVQKSGKTALPVSVFIGLNAFIGGFGASYLGVFMRMQGLGKTVMNKLASLRAANIEEIQSILTKIGVKERPATPLSLELTILYHNKVIVHLAANDLEGLSSITNTLGDMRASVKFDWQRSMMVGGVLYQQPMEIGVPISIHTGITAIGAISTSLSRSVSGGLMSQENKFKLQFHTFGLTRVSNYLPGLGTAHSISLQRTLRLLLPAQFTLGLDVKNKSFNIDIKPVTEAHPIVAVGHAITGTSLVSDGLGLGRALRIQEALKESCSTCAGTSTVSRGKTFRNSRVRDFKLIKGLKTSLKYFDCERDQSRRSTFERFRHIFDPRSKNFGIFGNPVTSSILYLHQARDAVFYSPQAGACGVSASVTQDKKDGNELEKIDGKLRGSIDPVNSKLSLEFNVALKYSSTSPTKAINIESFISHEEPSLDTQKLNLKVLASEEGSDKAGILCMDVNINANDIPKDLLCFQGENEPFIKQAISLKMGKLTKSQLNGKTTPCSTERADIQLNLEARQSNNQKNEAKLDIYPYKPCRDQKQSPLYPGTRFVPPTTECHLSVAQQTTLENVNISLSYKVNQDVKNRWRKPLTLLETLIVPYYVDADSVSDQEHQSHPSVDGVYSGEIEVDMNLKSDSPTANIHYHSHAGSSNTEEHFHDIELGLLPKILTPKAIPSRFSPLQTLGVKLGALGICSVTPQVVNTFDGASIPSPLSACLTLVSADCGKNPQFAILAKKLSAETIGLVIHIGENKIELDGGSSVKVNGQAKNLPDRVSQELPSSIKILKNGQEVYLSTRVDGINVRYTENFVTITLGSRYRSTQCGLCGNFDSSPYNDLIGPDLQCSKVLSPAQFFSSYVIPVGQCQGTPCPA